MSRLINVRRTRLTSRLRIPHEGEFSTRLRSPAVTARVGLWLGVCFLLAFLTGLYSHLAQVPDPWLTLPTRPVWLYRVTQGLHVVSGTAAVPLLLVKLWSVFPRLFARPPGHRVRELALHGAERVSIAVLVSAAVFQLATGLANTSQWYPWAFSFRATHYAVGWIAVGALLVHVAVKLPLIRSALGGRLDADRPGSVENRAADPGEGDHAGASDPGVDRLPDSDAPAASGLSRRGLLWTTGAAALVAVVTTAGATVPALRRISVFAVRSGDGPQGIPINTSARAAGVTAAATAGDFALTVVRGSRTVQASLADLERMPQHTARLPIACVEGWAASGTWTGVRVRDLVRMVGGDDDSAVLVTSLQSRGPFRETRLPAEFARAAVTSGFRS
jgi:DMSO/TMAO reductase YedYZ molybdopterin-dependent catalytic subunit